MSDEIIIALSCFGSALLCALALAYIFTAANRNKSKCTECGKDNIIGKAFIVDRTTGKNIEAERDFGYAITSGLSRMLIGAAVCAYIGFLVIYSLDNECSLKGMIIKCYSMGLETTIYIPIALIALVSSILAIGRGVNRMRRANFSSGKPLICELVCPSCKHTWIEEVTSDGSVYKRRSQDIKLMENKIEDNNLPKWD